MSDERLRELGEELYADWHEDSFDCPPPRADDAARYHHSHVGRAFADGFVDGFRFAVEGAGPVKLGLEVEEVCDLLHLYRLQPGGYPRRGTTAAVRLRLALTGVREDAKQRGSLP